MTTTIPIKATAVHSAAFKQQSRRTQLGVAPDPRLATLRAAAYWVTDNCPLGTCMQVSLDDLAILFPGELG